MALRPSTNARPRPAAQGADFEESAGTSCCPGCCPGWNSDCGSGGPKPGRVGRPSPGLGGEPACRAPNSEPESGTRRAGEDEGAGGAGDAGLPWIPDGDSLRQQSRPNAFPLQRAAGEGSETGGRKAPPVRRPEPRVGLRGPAKDPARCVVDPRPAPRHNDNLQPLRGNKFLELHYVKSLENSAGRLSVRKN